jgi:hypothetical protein
MESFFVDRNIFVWTSQRIWGENQLNILQFSNTGEIFTGIFSEDDWKLGNWELAKDRKSLNRPE